MHQPAGLGPRNPEVARLRALTRDRRARHDTGRFVVEGTKLVLEAVASDLDVLEAYADADWQPPADVTDALAAAGLVLTQVSTRGIERIASTTSPQPILAEVALPGADWADLATATAALVLVDVNDPGNVGTLTRSAVAAGFDAVIALGDTADPFAPKTVRASAGALFRVPVLTERDAATGLDRVAALGLRRHGTRMLDAVPCDEIDLTGPLALVLGSEAHGLGGAHATHIDEWVAIPMPGDIESLNVAMAGTILAYETARQRRSGR